MSGLGTPEGYVVGRRPRRPGSRFGTSPTEILHAGLSFAVLTFAFADVGAGTVGRSGSLIPPPEALLSWIPFGALAALTGFLLHEIAHKVAAQRHGFWAEFRMSPFGLMACLLVVLVTGFIFAAPGATMIGGMGDEKEWGRTSLAGPTVNLIEGTAFLGLLFVAPLLRIGAWIGPLELLVFLNAWFAAFNLIPYGPLDGAKVWRWHRGIWAVAFAVAIAFSVLFYLLVFLGIGSV